MVIQASRGRREASSEGFAGPFKECELYSKSDGKPLKGLKPGHDIIRCTGLKGYLGCCAENGLNGGKKCEAPTPSSLHPHPARRTTLCQLRHYPISTIPHPSSRPGAPDVHGPQRAARHLRQRTGWLPPAGWAGRWQGAPKCRASGREHG